MNGYKGLNEIKVGESATVKSIDISGPMRRRLLDIGLIEESRVECLFKGPSGNPVAYLICGAVIALRNTDAVRVRVI